METALLCNNRAEFLLKFICNCPRSKRRYRP